MLHHLNFRTTPRELLRTQAYRPLPESMARSVPRNTSMVIDV
jgi:hypothetical protein